MSDTRSKIEAFIRKTAKGGRPLLPSRLLDRIADATKLSKLDIQDCLAVLSQEGLIDGVGRNGIPLKKVYWKGTSLVQADPVALMVRDYFNHRDIQVSDNDALALSRTLHGLDPQDIGHLLDGLCQIQGSNEEGTFASALNLLGSAKALSGLSSSSRFLKAMPLQEVGEMFVITAGPVDPKAVLLIENLRSFTAFTNSDHADSILGVASYGYGLTMQNFATHLLAGKVTACPCRGDRPDLKQLIQSKPVYLWGDLDREGLRIFETLKKEIPHMSLSAAYENMEALLKDPSRGHPYHRLFEKDGQRTVAGSSPEVAHLSVVCKERAVDQEALGSDINSIDLAKPYVLK
ncbi:Wadjet anti-phage system protein JetD domain-containing protein [Zhongshania sp.]|uniref:Wadjet anti-phage system protein JetD domain-containing protein n=1 Tax=Zhongshania sp. TaxID=1971902 RepID=UPI002A811DB6|nr:Wadjet anti-phage system protein JetD domain-containing protein [Zhongshania sp.]